MSTFLALASLWPFCAAPRPPMQKAQLVKKFSCFQWPRFPLVNGLASTWPMRAAPRPPMQKGQKDKKSEKRLALGLIGFLCWNSACISEY